MPQDLKIKSITVAGNPAATGDVKFAGDVTQSGNTFTIGSGGAPLTDGDKGDITVSGTGATWTIDAGLDATKIADGSVTSTEFQYLNTVTSNVQDQLNGKAPSLGVDDNYVTDAEKIVIGNTSGTNTGDQTSIVGITGTKAQFDTAVTDGNFLYVGDVTTNATHTGEVTGSGALTVDKTAITGKSAVTAVGTDYVLISDTSDSGNLKKALASDFGGAGGTPAGSDTQVQFNDAGVFGADAELSYNKTSNTLSVNNITSNAGTGLSIATPAAVAASDVNITSGNSSAGNGGDIFFNAGTGTTRAGYISLYGANATGASGQGSIIEAYGGNSVGNESGGYMYFQAGNGAGSGAGGDFFNYAGTGGATGTGGAIEITAGNGGATSGVGGSVNIAGGNTATASAGGSVNIAGGNSSAGTDGNVVLGNPGKVEIQKEGSALTAIFDANSITATSKTFTFPNTTGTFLLGTSGVTANAILRADGTSGNLAKGSVPTISDTGDLTIRSGTSLVLSNADNTSESYLYNNGGTGVSAPTLSHDLSVPDEVYGVGWNGSLEVPTKNAVYDKIETLSAGSGITLGQALALTSNMVMS